MWKFEFWVKSTTCSRIKTTVMCSNVYVNTIYGFKDYFFLLLKDYMLETHLNFIRTILA